jgi:hypothetical protein
VPDFSVSKRLAFGLKPATKVDYLDVEEPY